MTVPFIEPSAGNGVFVKHIKANWPEAQQIWAIELRPETEALTQAGATYIAQADWVQWVRYMADQAFFKVPPICIGNPPFSLAQAHLEAAFQSLPAWTNICFLLRYGFLGGRERTKTFWQEKGGQYLKYIIPIAPRPSFVKGKNDNSEYAVFVWEVGYVEKAQILPHILWEKRVRPLK